MAPARTTPAPSDLALASEEIRDVLAYAQNYLQSIKRPSGDDYCKHGLEVAMTLQEVSTDNALIRAAVLHDLPVHPQGWDLLKKSPLTHDEQRLVKRMHSLRRLHIDENTADLDRVIGAFTGDARLLLLRMAHRLTDVRHLHRFAPKRQREIAHETLHMYTAISGRLGFQRWRWQMEDICFLALKPKIAKNVQKQFSATREADHAALAHAKTFLQQMLTQNDIDATLDERTKGLYSTYRKMVIKKRKFEELTDRLAIRVIVPTVEDCYRALGVIHSCMRPLNSKLKDYIGTPKDNGYRSIHTVVYPLRGISMQPIEIQIRTRAMHQECEYGIASHADYKEWSYALTTNAARVNLFRNLENLQTVERAHRTFAQALRSSFSEERLLIFDAHNNLHRLPKPASAMDFACQAQPDICRFVTGVRINGRKQAFDAALRDGDTVQIISGDVPVPLKNHLRACQQSVTKKLLRDAWKKESPAMQKRSSSSAMNYIL